MQASDSFINSLYIQTALKMAKLRKFCAYRRLERPYTRKSKYRKLSFIKSTPNSKVVRYEAGNLTKEFPLKVDLISKDPLHIRHNAIESARLTSHRFLEKSLGKQGFRLSIRIYPHHILRENPLASGAGADRMSTGMKMSFGKAIGMAARVKPDQALMTVGIEKQHMDIAKRAMKRASYKFPCSCRIAVREQN